MLDRAESLVALSHLDSLRPVGEMMMNLCVVRMEGLVLGPHEAPVGVKVNRSEANVVRGGVLGAKVDPVPC